MKTKEPPGPEFVEAIFAAIGRMKVVGEEPDSIMMPEDMIPKMKCVCGTIENYMIDGEWLCKNCKSREYMMHGPSNTPKSFFPQYVNRNFAK